MAHELTHVVQQNGGVQRKIVQHQAAGQEIVQMMPKVKPGNLSVKDAQIALAKANKKLAFELAQTAADIAGIVDPTPISDGISAAMSLAKGDYVGAGLSIVLIEQSRELIKMEILMMISCFEIVTTFSRVR